MEKTRVEAENIMQVEMPKKLVFLNDFSRVRSIIASLTFLGDSRQYFRCKHRREHGIDNNCLQRSRPFRFP